jgi:hypothetical protein
MGFANVSFIRNYFYMKITDILLITCELALIVCFAVSIFLLIRKYRDLYRLWVAYDIARLTGDRAKAFDAAKAFYKRKYGRLTLYDQQIITSEINRIK